MRVGVGVVVGSVLVLSACGRSDVPSEIEPPAGFPVLTEENLLDELTIAIQDAGTVRFETLLEVEGRQTSKAEGVMRWDGDGVDLEASFSDHGYRGPYSRLIVVDNETYVSGDKWDAEVGLEPGDLPGQWIRIIDAGDAVPEEVRWRVDVQTWSIEPDTALSVLAVPGTPKPVEVEAEGTEELLRYWGSVEMFDLMRTLDSPAWLLDLDNLTQRGSRN